MVKKKKKMLMKQVIRGWESGGEPIHKKWEVQRYNKKSLESEERLECGVVEEFLLLPNPSRPSGRSITTSAAQS